MLPDGAPGLLPGGHPYPRALPLTSQAVLDTKMPLVLGGGTDEHRQGWASRCRCWSGQASGPHCRRGRQPGWGRVSTGPGVCPHAP